MKKARILALVIWIGTGLMWAIPLPAATASFRGTPPMGASATAATNGLAGLVHSPSRSTSSRNPGDELARTISQLTGVAISPLLGTGAVGAWRYFETPSAQRERLPWFAQPWFWVPALIIVGLAAAKDALGPVTPSALKKPMDVAEVLENKVSGLIAAGAFVPLAMGVFGSQFPGTTGIEVAPAGAGMAAATDSGLLNILLTPFAMIAFIAVWLLGHVIHALILISPFTTLDTVLKAVRAALLASVVGTSFASPWIGAVWALAIILVAVVLGGWTFRLNWLAAVFLFDVLSRRRRWFEADRVANKMFLAREVAGVPARTYGRVSRTDAGRLRFQYRPWLVGTEKEITFPEGRFCIGRGFIYADLLEISREDSRRIGILPPRYKNHEGALTEVLRLAPPQDVGLRAIWRAIKELLGFSGESYGAEKPAS